MLVCCSSGKRYDVLTEFERIGGCSTDHCKGPVKMKFTEDEKKIILEKYLAYVKQVSEDLEDKSVFSVDEIVYNILAIVEEM